MRIEFLKYHASGNDFAFIAPPACDASALARLLCRRREGVGADGLVVLRDAGDGWRMKIYNADGSAAEVCGNALRCVGAMLGGNSPIPVTTDAGVRVVTPLSARGYVTRSRVEMGEVRPVRVLDVTAAGKIYRLYATDVGNPHATAFVEDVRAVDLAALAAACPRDFFPSGVNLSVASVEADGVRGRVYERGCGETPACGSGACAIVGSAVYAGKSDPSRRTVVRMPGGDVSVSIEDGKYYLEGDAVFVGEGVFVCALE